MKRTLPLIRLGFPLLNMLSVAPLTGLVALGVEGQEGKVRETGEGGSEEKEKARREGWRGRNVGVQRGGVKDSEERETGRKRQEEEKRGKTVKRRERERL